LPASILGHGLRLRPRLRIGPRDMEYGLAANKPLKLAPRLAIPGQSLMLYGKRGSTAVR